MQAEENRIAQEKAEREAEARREATRAADREAEEESARRVQPRGIVGSGNHEWLPREWEKDRGRFDAVLRYPIPGVVQRNFQREINTTVMLCDAIYNEYKRFMILKELTKGEAVLVPSHLVKLAWEYHMIETSTYRRFCFDNFKKFIHSNPMAREVNDDLR